MLLALGLLLASGFLLACLLSCWLVGIFAPLSARSAEKEELPPLQRDLGLAPARLGGVFRLFGGGFAWQLCREGAKEGKA